jgi:hypothetical protein
MKTLLIVLALALGTSACSEQNEVAPSAANKGTAKEFLGHRHVVKSRGCPWGAGRCTIVIRFNRDEALELAAIANEKNPQSLADYFATNQHATLMPFLNTEEFNDDLAMLKSGNYLMDFVEYPEGVEFLVYPANSDNNHLVLKYVFNN